ncbi:DUF6343 family protein [Streptomyces sp. NPDC095817]|uniref:DUF6343 family protein n=1 Tax=Streptomyces sp. NPDC095817 TaxID=3155082 RepID=UPI00332D1E66
MTQRTHATEHPTRSRSGWIGRRNQRTGTEPTTARSALGLRVILATAGLILFLAATVVCARWAYLVNDAATPGRPQLLALTVGCGVITLLAAANLIAVTRRRARERGSRFP